MANIKKNFNFRNGVQVDDDNLLVTATGLVGIGTTVPTEALDVRGNVKIIGDANITNATVGILTLTEVVPTQIIGAGVSIKSGIVTAQGTGIVTFYGDARYLQGMPTSQWIDTNAGFGVSSIYNTGGTVGIATTNPQSTLQVGNNVDGGESGVGPLHPQLLENPVFSLVERAPDVIALVPISGDQLPARLEHPQQFIGKALLVSDVGSALHGPHHIHAGIG